MNLQETELHLSDTKEPELPEVYLTNSMELPEKSKPIYLLIPLFPFIVILIGLIHFINPVQAFDRDNSGFRETGGFISKTQGKFNILSEEDLSKGIKDTVYTEFDCWLELRIDQQMVHQHWRNGKVESFPVSTGNKYLSRSVESRPGLFAIFYKNAHHQSSQYNNADMYDFMPFNQGIGFHSLNGTGYYGALGKTPSSHGCIRMRHQDVQKLFKDCPLGTLVIAHRGTTCRTVGFAPKDFKNEKEFSKDEFKLLLAENIYNIVEGKYYLADRKYFVINPDIIPKSGIYIGYDRKIPERQILPKSKYIIQQVVNRLNSDRGIQNINLNIPQYVENNANDDEENSNNNSETAENSGNVSNNIPYTRDELVKIYFHNPIGILPYFPPVNK